MVEIPFSSYHHKLLSFIPNPNISSLRLIFWESMERRRCVHGPGGISDKTMCATLCLRDLLQLGNNPTLFQNFKQQLYHVAENHLALKDAPRQQADRWIAIEAELLSSFPDIFDVEDRKTRLELAMQIIASYHYQRRVAFKNRTQPAEHLTKRRSLVMSVSVPTRAALKKKRKEGKKRKENDIIDLTNDSDDEYDAKQKVEFVEPKLPQMMDMSNLPIKVAPPSTLSLTSISSYMAGPSIPQSPAVLIKSQSTPLHAESSSQAHYSNNGNHGDAFQLTGVTQVARFLNACFPPMAHFLPHFIDFGCTSEELLVAVSTWPTHKISHFLSQVSGHGGDKRKFSEMDMLILRNHFMSYFNKAQT